MSRLFYHVMQDNVGNLLFDVSGTMRLAGTGTLATIYGDEALTVILPNPMTNHPSFGSFKCFLGAGDYDFYMAKAGYTFETLTGVQGHGTMAQQDAGAVAITGGSATLTGGLAVPQQAANNTYALYSDMAEGGTDRWFIKGNGTAPSVFGGHVLIPPGKTLLLGAGTPTPTHPNARANIYPTATQVGIEFRPDSDATPYAAHFRNMAGASIGAITTNATTTTYATSSDARLKYAVEPMTGALDVVRALNPVSFLWRADGSPGRGLLAGEVQEVIPDGVITGERGAIDDDGRILPQMIDYSKLVPYLIGAVKELTQQVEMLQAQLAAAGA